MTREQEDLTMALAAIARRDAEIGRLLATLDAWRLVTGADTPEALAAELDAYRVSARRGARHA